MNLNITEEQLEVLLDKARKDLVAEVLSDKGEDLKLITPAQVCGILDINQKTLDELTDGHGNKPIPRVTIVPGRVIRYRLTDVRSFILSRLDPSAA